MLRNWAPPQTFEVAAHSDVAQVPLWLDYAGRLPDGRVCFRAYGPAGAPVPYPCSVTGLPHWAAVTLMVAPTPFGILFARAEQTVN